MTFREKGRGRVAGIPENPKNTCHGLLEGVFQKRNPRLLPAMKVISILPCLLFLSACLSSLEAQEFPSPKPGAAHKLFARDAGTWDAQIRLYVTPGAPPLESKAVVVNTLICGGLYLQQHFKGKMGDADFEGHGLTGYDPVRNRYIGTWVDSSREVPLMVTSRYDVEKKAFVSEFDVDAGDGNMVKIRQVRSYLDDGKLKQEQFLLLGETPVKTMEILYLRRSQEKEK